MQLRHLKAVEVVDPRTVRLTLTTPDVLILDFLASPQGTQISPKSLREAKNLKAGGVDVVGTGPFVLDRYVAGQELHYRRNPGYDWARQPPPTPGPPTSTRSPTGSSRSRRCASAPSPRARCRSSRGCPPPTSRWSPATGRLRLNRELNSGSAYSYYFNTSHAPFDDLRVRQAFREAVDVDTVLKSVYRDTATRAWSVVSPSSPLYDKRLEGGYSGDTAKANTLLDQAGWAARDADGYRVKAGKRLTVRLVQSAPFVRDRRDVLAQAVQAAVKQSAGIDLKVSLVDQGTATEAFQRNEYEVFDNSRADTDAGAALNLLLHSRAASTAPTSTIPASTSSWKPVRPPPTRQARAGIYAELQQRVVAEQALRAPALRAGRPDRRQHQRRRGALRAHRRRSGQRVRPVDRQVT